MISLKNEVCVVGEQCGTGQLIIDVLNCGQMMSSRLGPLWMLKMQ